MSKKLLTIGVIITIFILLLIIGYGAYKYLKNKNILNLTNGIQLNINNSNSNVDRSTDFSNELVSVFNTTVPLLNLPDNSNTFVDSYVGQEDQNTTIPKFENNISNHKDFYMASTIKPLFISAYLNILNIKDLNYKISFKFVEDAKVKTELSKEISDYLKYKYPTDQLLVDTIVPFFKDATDTSQAHIYDQLMNNPQVVNYQFNLKQLIQYTLGPSSNFGLTIIRNNLALLKGGDEKLASDLIENYLNSFLSQQNTTGNIVVNYSTKSVLLKKFNTIYFDQAEYLFEDFYQNKFNLVSDIFSLMKNSMKDVAADPTASNRRLEIKSMAIGIFGNNVKADIMEKSGYIGLDYEAAPTLDIENKWDKVLKNSDQRIVIFNSSSFARIYLNNNKYVQFNYALAVPISISLNPSYEELNVDYLTVKNKIADLVTAHLKEVLVKYKDQIKTINNL